MTLIRNIDLGLPLWRVAPRLTGEGVFLLDSALDPVRLGRWSFTGCRPPALLTAKRRRGTSSTGPGMPFLITLTTWRRPDGTPLDPPRVRTWSGDPFAALRHLQAAYQLAGPTGDDSSGPFTGGLVGWFGYGILKGAVVSVACTGSSLVQTLRHHVVKRAAG